jgi:riboflavin kinase/FMN adenylyltransferase
LKVYYALEDFSRLRNAVVTTGTFDGVHIGHKKILDQLNETARSCDGESVLLTFHPHPRIVLQPDIDLKLLNTQQEKIELLKETGLDHLIIHPFTREFSRTKSMNFVRDYLVNRIGATKLVIGYDHHFGRNREGSFEHLKEFGPLYGFEVEEIAAEDVDHVTVSSTKIRNALSEGDTDTANEYLGYAYSLTGKIVSGDRIGKELGFPTANLLIDDTLKLVPGDGIYAVDVEFPATPEESFEGLCNIGMRPTFSGTLKTIETYILDFNREIYGEQMTIRFKKYLRPEVKFDSREELIEQMHKDVQEARIFFDHP